MVEVVTQLLCGSGRSRSLDDDSGVPQGSIPQAPQARGRLGCGEKDPRCTEYVRLGWLGADFEGTGKSTRGQQGHDGGRGERESG